MKKKKNHVSYLRAASQISAIRKLAATNTLDEANGEQERLLYRGVAGRLVVDRVRR